MIHPFHATHFSPSRFVVFSKRHEVSEARMRVFCMTDDKEDKTLEHQEHFQEVAKSRDVEVRGLLRLYLVIYSCDEIRGLRLQH